MHRKSRRISGRCDSGYSLAPPTSSPTSDTRSLRVYYGMYCLRTRPPYSKVLPSRSLSNILQYCSHRQNISLYCMFYHLLQQSPYYIVNVWPNIISEIILCLSTESSLLGHPNNSRNKEVYYFNSSCGANLYQQLMQTN